jgi:hypothetical protein
MHNDPKRFETPLTEEMQVVQPIRGKHDRYAVALDAALQILEDLDTLPGSNAPVRLATVIGIVLDALYKADWKSEGDIR